MEPITSLELTRGRNGLIISQGGLTALRTMEPWVEQTVAKALVRILLLMFPDKRGVNSAARSMGMQDPEHAVGILMFSGTPEYVSAKLGITPVAGKASSAQEEASVVRVEAGGPTPAASSLSEQPDLPPADDEDFNFAPAPPEAEQGSDGL